jgi:alpha/beta superfamily hydrolase
VIARFETEDGLTLDGAWSLPDGNPAAVVVLCHPDPTQRGTMNAPLMTSLAAALADSGIAVLRFDFRGVGRSEGVHGGGVAEIADVDAAVRTATDAHPGLDIGVAGWSFGAVVALRWQAETRSTLRYAGIAPPVWFPDHRGKLLPDPTDLAPAERLFVLGDRDQFVTVDDLRAYADEIEARLEVLPGSDHFFYFREAVVASALVAHFG